MKQPLASASLRAAARYLQQLAGLLACLIPLHGYGAPGATSAPDNMETRVLACTSCHGLRGQGMQGDYFPRLAGRPAGYLYNQLVAFRSGRRNYAPMNYLLEYQSDAYLQAMASYFASQNPPYLARTASTTSGALLARGEALATQGDASRNIPSCASCHNPSFTGVNPGIPALLGLRSRYISAQLGAWRYGTRTAGAPDCMQIVAEHLSEDDVTAVAAWLSSAAVPLKSAPLPPGSLITPLPCGSASQ